MMIFTIGHSNLPLASFVELLRRHEITTVVDVRSQPFSSYSPQFNRDQIKTHLELNNIDYRFLGHKLGGHPATRAFCCPDGTPDYFRIEQDESYQQGINELIQIAETERVAVMCSEGDFRKCHRYHLIAKTLVLRGIEVKHIQSDGSLWDNPAVQLSLEVS